MNNQAGDRLPFASGLAVRRVLITGGSRGIAGAIAKGFAESGSRIALNYSAKADEQAGFPDAAEKAAQQLRSSGGEVVMIEVDLTQQNAGERLAEGAVAALGSIDIAVLSASIQIHKDFLDQSLADIALQFQINLIANIQILQKFIPAMRRNGWGRIITIGSVQENVPSKEMPIYSLTKSALENLVRNLAIQNARFGITVNNIAPGLIQTDRNAFRRRNMSEWESFAANANPAGRAGVPDDVAGAALFLASNAASFITGSTIQASGGAHIPWTRRAPAVISSADKPSGE